MFGRGLRLINLRIHLYARAILIVGVARCEGWKRAPMKRFVGATVPEGHGGARCDGETGPTTKYAGWQCVEKDAPVKPFLVVKAFSSHSHYHTKRATNDAFSLHRLHPPTPPPGPCSGSDANASSDGSFVGRSS